MTSDMVSLAHHLLRHWLVYYGSNERHLGDHGPGHLGYCRFGNFRLTFISRIFHFQIIHDFLNLRATI